MPTPLAFRLGSAGAIRQSTGDRGRLLGLLSASLVLGGCNRESVVQLDGGSGPGVPMVEGLARYEDRNLDGVPGQGDVLIVPFSTEVVLRGALVSDFELLGSGDFGSNPTLVRGPAANEVTITLGDGASLKTRRPYVLGELASGIDVQDMLADGVIENPHGGLDALRSTPVDIVPGFVDSGQRVGNDPTRSVALGDLDGDQDLDLVECNFGPPSRIWLNDGSGHYPGPPSQELPRRSTRAVLLVDVDEDGDLDLVLGNAANEADELWENDGTGTFQLRQLFGAADTSALAAGDLDGDRDPDLVVADASAPNVVWENVDGFFFQKEALEDACPGTDEIPPGCPTRDVALADVDRDGELDLVEGNWNEPDLVRLNQEDEEIFGDAAATRLGSGATSSVALGDLDLDGDPDLVVGDGLAASRVWLNGGGNFADSGQQLGREGTSDVVLADFDNDGVLDLVAAAASGNRLWVNDHTGHFVDSRRALSGAHTAALAVGDVDGDEDLDLVAGNENGPNRVWLQSLAGTSGAVTLEPIMVFADDSQSGQPVVADLDLDGDFDLVTGGSSLVFHNDGGDYLRRQFLSPGISTSSIAVGDIDGDGYPDLIEAQNGDGVDDRVWINNRAGTFELSSSLEFDNSHDSLDVELVDVDLNGDLDYVYTHNGSGLGIAIWTNDEGSFTDTDQSLGAGSTQALAVGDIDANGFPEILESFSSGLCRTWVNVGGLFTSSGSNLTLSKCSVSSLVLGDLDGDGDLDLGSADCTVPGDAVWFNDGRGSFTRSAEDLVGNAWRLIVAADLDADGDLDLVSGGNTAFHAFFLNQRGTGAFDAAHSFDQIEPTQGLASADVDLDGDVDILAESNLASVEVWFNR